MRQSEARELMKENWDEINLWGYEEVHNIGELNINCEEGSLYFKPKQKLPIVFEDEFYKIEVFEESILINHKYGKESSLLFRDEVSLPMLEEAIKKRNELQK